MQFTNFSTMQKYCIAEKDIIKEGFDGYEIKEREDISGKCFIYFKDITKDKDVERFFEIRNRDLERFKTEYSRYFNNCFEAFLKVQRLKSISTFENYEKIYNENYMFFAAINMSFNEWKGVNGILEYQ